MADPKKTGCVNPAAGPIPPPGNEPSAGKPSTPVNEVPKMQAKVGKPAPDFEANGFFKSDFDMFKLSSYKGKWVLLCFYPGDFTFV